MSKFIPSKYQQALFDWITKGTGSAIVEAVAGSGKTTSVIQALQLIDSKKQILFLAFNKSIAEELKERAPKHVNCMTMNSLGHRAVMKQFGRLTLEPNKTWMALDILLEEEQMTKRELDVLGFNIKKLIDIAKSVGLVPVGMDLVSLIPDTMETWDDLIDYHDLDFSVEKSMSGILETLSPEETMKRKLRTIELVRAGLKLSIEETSTIDFNDQLYFPVIYGLSLPQYDWVFVDEAQDISAIQRSLLVKALRKEGRLVAVGDPKQAIYGFRGADSDSLTNIAKTFNCISLPLSISYRCPKSVVREAQRFVSHIEPSDTAVEGLVQELGEAIPSLFRIKDMVVCRNVAPLIALAYNLIKSKVPAKVMGRDIGEGLVNLVKKLRAKSIVELEEKLDRWKTKEMQKIIDKGDPEPDFSRIEDKFECLTCFIEHSGAESIEALIVAIQNLFGEKSGGNVVLATIHKAKGLESKRVFILDSWRMPSHYAKKAHQLEQENNLFYVAITRAQEELYYVDMPKKKVASF